MALLGDVLRLLGYVVLILTICYAVLLLANLAFRWLVWREGRRIRRRLERQRREREHGR